MLSALQSVGKLAHITAARLWPHPPFRQVRMYAVITIIIYLLLMVGLGLWATRRSKNVEDYRLAGRQLGPLMYTGTMSAVVIGGSATVGGVALGYQHGISALWMVTAIAAGLLLLSLFIAGPVRRVKVYTINQVLDLRYGKGTTSKVSSLVTVLYTLTLAINSTSVYATIFVVLFPNMGRGWAVFLGGSVVVLYSVFGGMWSITLTDMMQFIFMTVGMFFILLPFSLYHAGGISGLTAALPDTFFSPTGIGFQMVVTYFVTFTLGMLIGQDIWQRVFTSRTPAVAKWGGTASAIYVTLYAITGAIIGMAGRVIIPNVEEGKYGEVFAMLANGYLPPILGGIVLAAGVAAMMSTASGTLIAAATVTRVDIAPVVKSLLRGGDASVEHPDDGGIKADRIYVLIFGIFVTFMAVFLTDPVMGMVIGYDFLVGGLFIPVLGGLVWKRATGTGAWTAMLAGVVAVTIGMFIFGPLENEPIYVGLAASLIVFVVVSLATPATPHSVWENWQARLASRHHQEVDDPTA